jgi:hypothetical protein
MMNCPYLKRKGRCLPILRLSIIALLTILPLIGLGKRVALAQPANGISQPASGETVVGVVTVVGTAVHPDYLRYELAFRYVSDPTADWIVFADGGQPVQQGTLALWDTTVGRAVGAPVFPDGQYQLRLRVVRTDFNYDEYFVTDLTVANDQPTPTPTDEPEAAETPPPVLPVAPGEGEGTAVFQQPTPLPSLTPFPTPTRPPAAAETPSGLAAAPTEAGGGLFDQVAAIDTGQFARAFWGGVQITGLIFAAMGLYLLVRWALRWGWRSFWQWREKQKQDTD